MAAIAEVSWALLADAEGVVDPGFGLSAVEGEGIETANPLEGDTDNRRAGTPADSDEIAFDGDGLIALSSSVFESDLRDSISSADATNVEMSKCATLEGCIPSLLVISMIGLCCLCSTVSAVSPSTRPVRAISQSQSRSTTSMFQLNALSYFAPSRLGHIR